jgi:hypothetical protein
MIRLNCDDWAPVVSDLNKPIKDWYVKSFPKDVLGPKIPDGLTFWDVVGVLNIGADVYCFLRDASDSVVRERIVMRIAEIIGCDYGTVYDTWMGG